MSSGVHQFSINSIYSVCGSCCWRLRSWRLVRFWRLCQHPVAVGYGDQHFTGRWSDNLTSWFPYSSTPVPIVEPFSDGTGAYHLQNFHQICSILANICCTLCTSCHRLSQLSSFSVLIARQPDVFEIWVFSLTAILASHYIPALCQLYHVRRFVTDDYFRRLVVSFIHSRLDFGNFILVRLPAYFQWQLQSVLNAAARLVFQLRCYNHITGALAALHGLRVPRRVDYTVAVMAFQAGLSPPCRWFTKNFWKLTLKTYLVLSIYPVIMNLE